MGNVLEKGRTPACEILVLLLHCPVFSLSCLYSVFRDEIMSYVTLCTLNRGLSAKKKLMKMEIVLIVSVV